MSQLDDEIAAEGLNDWLDEAGESITYLPAAGGERPIVGIVDRRPPQRNGPNGLVTHPVEITVANDPASGISGSELDTGRDQIRFAVVEGAQPTVRRITDRVFDAGGMLILAIS